MILALLVCLAVVVAWLIIELIGDRHSFLPSPPPAAPNAYPAYGRHLRPPIAKPTPTAVPIAVEVPAAARVRPALSRPGTSDERTAALYRRLDVLERRTIDDARQRTQLARRTRAVHAAAHELAATVARTLGQPTSSDRDPVAHHRDLPLLLAAS